MKGIIAGLATAILFMQAGPAVAVEFDFTFTQSGEIVVIDSFKKVGRSGVQIKDVQDLIETNKKLTREVQDLRREMEKMEKRLGNLGKK